MEYFFTTLILIYQNKNADSIEVQFFFGFSRPAIFRGIFLFACGRALFAPKILIYSRFGFLATVLTVCVCVQCPFCFLSSFFAHFSDSPRCQSDVATF